MYTTISICQEKVDEDLLGKILECPISTPKEMLYLEWGVSPIRSIQRSRRLNFLHYILNEETDSLMYTFLQAQLESPTRNDWGQTIHSDMEIFGIELSLDEIKEMSGESFKNLVRKKEHKASLEYLNSEKVNKNHTKVLHIKHRELAMQDYLKPNVSTIDESKFTFAARSRMLELRSNYKGQYIDSDILCPLCGKEEDNQPHLLVCEELPEQGALVAHIPAYSQLFGDSLDDMNQVSRILERQYRKRKSKLK